MKITEIYEAIENDLKVIEPEMNDRLDDLKKAEDKLNKVMAEYEEAEAAYKKLHDKVDALYKAREALEDIYLTDLETKTFDEKEVELPVEKKTTEKNKKIEIKWTRKFGTLFRYDRNNNMIGKYCSQKAAARSLGWDQSSISRFIKLKTEEQIRKKGFYFKWEP